MFDDATAFELPANAPWYKEDEEDHGEFMTLNQLAYQLAEP